MLESKLNDDMKAALKSKDAVRVSVIRMLKADITLTAVRSSKQSLSDDEITKVIQKQIKQRNDSIEQFTNGARPDLAAKEKTELEVLKSYVPDQMDDAELEALVSSVIEKTGAREPKDMGRVMKEVLDAASARVDGKRVSSAVRRLLKGE